MKIILVLFLFLTLNISAQVESFVSFSEQDSLASKKHGTALKDGDNGLILFWAEGRNLYLSKSSNNGSTFNEKILLFDGLSVINRQADINAMRLQSNRILLTYIATTFQLIYSDDDGNTWSEPKSIPIGSSILRPWDSQLSETDDGTVWFGFTSHALQGLFGFLGTGSYILKSSDNGETWSDMIQVLDQNESGNITVVSKSDGSLFLTFLALEDSASIIYSKISTDGGYNWSEPIQLYSSNNRIMRPRLLKDSNSKFWIAYREYIPFGENLFRQDDIFYITSNDEGGSWSNPIKVTNYLGFDGLHNISEINDEIFVVFASDRFSNNRVSDELNVYRYVNLYLGSLENSEDILTPPRLIEYNLAYDYYFPNGNMRPRILIVDDDELGEVFFNYQFENNEAQSLELFDDGLHNDYLSNDGWFGNQADTIPITKTMNYNFSFSDNSGNIATTSTKTKELFDNGSFTEYRIEANNISMPINNEGLLAGFSTLDSTGASTYGGIFDGSEFLGVGGFALSGYSGDEKWTNGILRSNNHWNDYVPGRVGDINNPNNHLYVVKSKDPEFGQSWKLWSNAVELGAHFYDGDNNGEYNPVDLNGNGVWDVTEDKPDQIGDETIWCVYNDAEEEWRWMWDGNPMGIEIRQTVFAYKEGSFEELNNTIFIRYEIENMGTVNEQFDSVMFGSHYWTEIGYGSRTNDREGSDTLLNSSFEYRLTDDIDYGTNAPAFYNTIVQGPKSYIPGVTFIDHNSNNIYDDGIDTPLDTAYNHRSKLFGSDTYPGAKNSDATSFVVIMNNAWNHGYDASEWFYHLRGLDNLGRFIDPCTWYEDPGYYYETNCADANPAFMYSGDPVQPFGWLCHSQQGEGAILNTGPFDLKIGEPLTIIMAYSVGRGTDHLNSVSVTRDIVRNVQSFYSTNFCYVPVGVKENGEPNVVSQYSLYQNYPNPFNPTTKISYQIPEKGFVNLTVYDILGRKIVTLINMAQNSGNYEISFDASNLTSGVYFYRLISGNFNESKKMILIR